MKKLLLIIVTMFICSQQISAQKASDVLENGWPVKSGHRIFLKYDFSDKELKIDAIEKDENADFIKFEDSTIFLVHKNGINIYLKPLNPINYNYSKDLKIVIDPINKTAADAQDIIGGVIGTVTDPTKKGMGIKGLKGFLPDAECDEFKILESKIKDIQEALSNSKRDNIVKQFEFLKAVTFAKEKTTIDALNTANDSIKSIATHFDKVKMKITEAQTKVKDYPCSYPEPFIAKYIFTSIINELSLKMEEQKKRLTNLQEVYKLIKAKQEEASEGGGTDQLKWCIPLNEIPSKEGKISIYTITINENGYKLSEEKEIVKTEPKEVIKRTLRVRKFQRFVPEVSIGTAFTFFKYNSYGTTSDATGQQYVSTPTENSVKNLNISTMINFNYYIPNSALHPFYQLGVGINSEIPTVLTGLGIRSNVNGIKRLAISGGLAMSWIKELDKLEPGDPITGTDDIDKDYKYSSAPKFTPYVALQYNF